MKIYPITFINPLPSESYYVEIGHVNCYPFMLQSGNSVIFSTVHTAQVQDWSIKMWVSTVPLGTSIELFHPILKNWNPIRKAVFRICLYTNELPILEDDGYPIYSLKVNPGSFVINALNLTNYRNQFHMFFETLTA